MKKLISVLLVSMMLLTCAFALADTGVSQLLGSWSHTYTEEDKVYFEMPSDCTVVTIIEFAADGTAHVTANVEYNGESFQQEGDMVYTYTDGQLVINNGEGASGMIQGTTLILNNEGYQMIYERMDAEEKAAPESLVGTWVYEADEAALAAAGAPAGAAVTEELIFTADGHVTVHMIATVNGEVQQDQSQTTVYTYENGVLIMDGENQMNVTVEGDTIIISSDSATLTFVRK